MHPSTKILNGLPRRDLNPHLISNLRGIALFELLMGMCCPDVYHRGMMHEDYLV